MPAQDYERIVARYQDSSAERANEVILSPNMKRTGIVSGRTTVGFSRPTVARLDSPVPDKTDAEKKAPNFPMRRMMNTRRRTRARNLRRGRQGAKRQAANKQAGVAPKFSKRG
jgi:hypothetical protein